MKSHNKQTYFFRTLTVILTLIMLIPCLSACGNTISPSTNNNGSNNNTEISYSKIVYCNLNLNSEKGVWDEYLTFMSETTKNKAEYKAEKFYNKDDILVKCEIRNKYTNHLELILEFNNKENLISYYEPIYDSKMIYEYSQNGKLSKIILTKPSLDSVYGYITFEYNSDGKRTKQIHYNANDDSIKSSITYEYDTNGYVIKENHQHTLYNKEYSYVFAYDYDNNGNVVKENYYSNDELHSYTVYEYVKSTLIKETTYNEKNVIVSFVEYDNKGNELHSVSTLGRVYSHTQIEYDENESIIKKLYYKTKSDKEPYEQVEYTFEYDSYGNIIRESISGDGKIFITVERQYDKDENCLKSIAYNPTGTILDENDGYLRCVNLTTINNEIGITKYNHDGQEIKYSRYDTETESICYYREYAYINGKQCELKTYSDNSNIFIDTSYSISTTYKEYDNNGNIIKATTYNCETSGSNETFEWNIVSEYDSYGNISKTSYYMPENIMILCIKYITDNNNKITKFEIVDANNNVIAELDNNWRISKEKILKLESGSMRFNLYFHTQEHQSKLFAFEFFNNKWISCNDK